jgi:hypothetical protein
MQDLIKSVIADGVVDADEVVELKKAFYADGVIDQEEADAMFQINDAVSGNENDETYKSLFVEVLSDFVLKDEETPGVIDETEGAYLVEKIQGDGEIDDVEKALLLNIEANAIEIQSTALVSLIASIK